MRHEDVDALRGVVVVRQRLNVNRARAKTFSREVPVDPALVRLYSDYLHEEYGPLDCDYVFVNLWAEPVGRPMSFRALIGLFGVCAPGPGSVHAAPVPA